MRLIIIIFTFYSVASVAQESTNTSGGDATGTGGSSSYTLGETIYTTDTGTNGSVNKGVQQPYDISSTVGTELVEIELKLNAYPNPTSDVLNLNIGNYNKEKLSYKLYTIQGELLESNVITNSETTIYTDKLEKSTYLLKIIDDKKIVKIFKVIKN